MWISFSDRVGVHAQVVLKMCVRGTHDQRSLTQHEEKGYWVLLSCGLVSLLTWVWVIVEHSQEFAWVLFFCSSWVNECWSCTPLNTHFQENLCVNPNSTRKRYPHLVFCIVGLKVDLEDHFSWIWVHDFKVDTPSGEKKSYGRYISAPLYGPHLCRP